MTFSTSKASTKHPAVGLILFSLGLISACSTNNTIDSNISTERVLSVSADSHLTINQPINVNPGYTRIFIQDGVIVSNFNHYVPNCNLEVRKKDDTGRQLINPATYRITSLQETLEQVVRFTPGKKKMIAFYAAGQLPPLNLLASNDDSGQSDIYRGMHFYLAGDDSNLMRLSCRGVYAPPNEARLPTHTEIIEALGQLITLDL